VRIVSIVWYKVLPPQFGGQKGIAYFNQQIARHHPLVCVCSGNNEPADDLLYEVRPVLPQSKLQFLQPSAWKKIKEAVTAFNATHIILEHPYHGIAAVKAAKASGAKLVVHSHNIESLRFRSQGKWWWRLLAAYEKWTHRKADLNIFKTADDLQWAVNKFKLDPARCMVLPYGIERPAKDEEAAAFIRRRHNIAAGSTLLLFAGTLDYAPNAQAMESIFKTLIPLLEKQERQYHIIICGRNQLPAFRHLYKLRHPLVTVTGEVKDIDRYFNAADVFINPVMDSSGIQTKNIDALSFDLPMVCFRNTLTGIDTSLCGDRLLSCPGNDWKAFAAAIEKASMMPAGKTPDDFFNHYSFRTQVDNLLTKLNNED
jgi:glycosyltransferase involved in cell wall biosynthesis